jgi:hypothetical protein
MVWQILARSSRRGQPSGARVVSIPDAHPLFRERPPGSREPPVFPGGGPFPPLSGNDSGRERCFPAPVLGLPFPPGPAFPAGNREAGNAQPPSRRPAPAPPRCPVTNTACPLATGPPGTSSHLTRTIVAMNGSRGLTEGALSGLALGSRRRFAPHHRKKWRSRKAPPPLLSS